MSESVAGSPRTGAAALNNMALMKAESNIFKVPALPRSGRDKGKKNSQVLDEDDYVEGIARIIQRDFFPDLERLRAQNEYLEASENKDYVRLLEITRKYSGARPPTLPYATPATFDTPRDRPYSPAPPPPDTVRHDTSCSEDANTISKNLDAKDIISKHSLDSFLAQHTSEDNSSYDRLIALEEKKRASRSAAQFESERTSAQLVDAALALPSIEQQADQTERPHELDTWTYKARNYIMYVPDGSHSPPPTKPELQHANTRLHANPFNNQASRETLNQINKTKDAARLGKIGVDGACAGASERQLLATPSPRPGGVGDESPLMTWGEIEGTPFRLDGGDTPLPALGAGAGYRMLEWGARERIGLKLAEQAAKKRRPTTPRMRTPTPRMGTDRLASMSPAARKLAAKHLLTPRLKLTNRSSPRTTPTPKTTTPRRTPLVTAQGKKVAAPKTQESAEINNLTDNLLNINVQRRLTAKDFFK